MGSTSKLRYTFQEYSRADLMELGVEALGGVLRERVHHMIEVPLYPTLLRWKGKAMPNFGEQAQLVFDVWKERGLPEDTPDMDWVKKNLQVAERLRAGMDPEVDEPLPTPFDEGEMEVVRKLIWERRSIRDWTDKPIPDDLIDQILEAGNAAPIGCNLGHLRFVVLTTPEEKAMIWSDISTKNAAAIIVVCHDKRVPRAIGHDRLVPQNPGFDAAAAGTQMLLMAHALGLGAVWLSELKKSSKTSDTGMEFKEKYGLPEELEVHFHLALGWTAIGSIKSARPALADLVIRR
jgi:nitroreductase